MFKYFKQMTCREGRRISSSQNYLLSVLSVRFLHNEVTVQSQDSLFMKHICFFTQTHFIILMWKYYPDNFVLKYFTFLFQNKYIFDTHNVKW
jgi:hypothetical protein